jgi:hypothetical protein
MAGFMQIMVDEEIICRATAGTFLNLRTTLACSK